MKKSKIYTKLIEDFERMKIAYRESSPTEEEMKIILNKLKRWKYA